MKVILREDIESLGTFGDIVKVAPGYARNFLIPRGFAAPATQGNINQFEAEKVAWMKRALKVKEAADKVCATIEAVTLTFERKVGEEGGKLFGSVTSMDIEAALKEKGYDIDKKKIVLAEPIKSLGEFTVHVKLHREVRAAVKVVVESDAPVVEEKAEAPVETPVETVEETKTEAAPAEAKEEAPVEEKAEATEEAKTETETEKTPVEAAATQEEEAPEVAADAPADTEQPEAESEPETETEA